MASYDDKILCNGMRVDRKEFRLIHPTNFINYVTIVGGFVWVGKEEGLIVGWKARILYLRLPFTNIPRRKTLIGIQVKEYDQS